MKGNPPPQRLSYQVPLTPSKVRDLGDTAVFEYDYPIGWIIQCNYVGFNASFANTGQVLCWFKASDANAGDVFYYTSRIFNGSLAFVNQSKVSFLGSTFKVFGKKIQTFLELVSDAETANVVVTAIPQVQEVAGAMLENTEQDFVLQAATLFSLPFWATHLCVMGQLVDGLEFYQKDGVTLIQTYNQLSVGQYIKIPSDCVFLKNVAAIRVSIKFYGVQ